MNIMRNERGGGALCDLDASAQVMAAVQDAECLFAGNGWEEWVGNVVWRQPKKAALEESEGDLGTVVAVLSRDARVLGIWDGGDALIVAGKEV